MGQTDMVAPAIDTIDDGIACPLQLVIEPPDSAPARGVGASTFGEVRV